MNKLLGFLCLLCVSAQADLVSEVNSWTNRQFIGIIGDSIAAGYPLATTRFTITNDGPQFGGDGYGDHNAIIGYRLNINSTNVVTATNFGYHGYQWYQVRANELTNWAIPSSNKVWITYCGVNDAAAASSWTTSSNAIEGIRQVATNNNVTLMITECAPGSGLGGTANNAVRTINANMSNYCTTYGLRWIRTRPWLASPTNDDMMVTGYEQADGIHWTTNAYDKFSLVLLTNLLDHFADSTINIRATTISVGTIQATR